MATHVHKAGRFAILVALLAPALAVAGPIKVQAPRPGHIFFDRELIELALTGPPGEVQFTVTRHDGQKIAESRLHLNSKGRGVLRLRNPGRGWFLVNFQFPGGTDWTAFAVLPPPQDDGRRWRLFGASYRPTSLDLADAISLAGCRGVRFDMAWPDVERNEGQLTDERVGAFVSNICPAGVQFLPILGYSPGWLGVKPEDAEGRPATAAHTWPLRSIEAWPQYLIWCRQFADRMQPVQWPPQRLVRQAKPPGDGPPPPRWPWKVNRQARPAIGGWEIWNEVDQSFYYGPWHQYVDLLRLAHMLLDSLDRPVIYGGSCGHWTEAALAFNWDAGSCFDFTSFHPSGQIELSLQRWLFGGHMLPFRFAMPRRYQITEAHFTPPAGWQWHGYALRVALELIRWHAVSSYWFIATAPKPDEPNDVRAWCWDDSGDLVPTKLLAGFAFARWLVCSSAWVGRTVQDGTVMHMLIRRGQPWLALWRYEGEADVQVPASGQVAIYDCLGLPTRTAARSGSITVTATASPIVITPVAWSEVADVAREQFASLTETQLAVQPETDARAGYVGLVRDDIRWWAAAEFDALAAKVSAACQLLEQGPGPARPAFAEAAAAARRMLRAMIGRAVVDPHPERVMNALIRAVWLARWVCELADAVAEPPQGWRLPPPELSAARAAVQAAWREAVDKTSGLEKHRARTIVRWAHEILELAEASRGPEMARLARTVADCARKFASAEQPTLTGIQAFMFWPTSTFMVKAQRLEPGKPHKLIVRVYNATSQPASGTVRVVLPESWQPCELSAAFSCPPMSWSAPAEFNFTIPASPPWVTKQAWRPGALIDVLVPEDIEPNGTAKAWAEVDGLGTSNPTFALMVVGKWPAQ